MIVLCAVNDPLPVMQRGTIKQISVSLMQVKNKDECVGRNIIGVVRIEDSDDHTLIASVWTRIHSRLAA